jgi:hypothetical protein
VGAAGGAEAPRALDRFRDPDPGTGDDLRRLAVGRCEQERLATEIALVVAEVDPKCLGQLARPRAELGVGLVGAAAGAHLLDPMSGLQRPDQDRRRLALGFGDRVEEAMDPVGEVDVGVAGRAEEDPRALGQADVGVAGWVVGLIALGLDDDAAAALVEERAADEVTRNSVDRAIVKAAIERLCPQARSSRARACTAASASRASAICFARGAEPVPPAIRFDSSQLLRCSTS